MTTATRVARTLVIGCALVVCSHIASAQSPAVQIGYAPALAAAPTSMVVQIYVESSASSWRVAFGFPSAAGNDANAVMTAIDAVMAAGTYKGAPAFGPPVAVPGVMPGEVRHQYPFVGEMEVYAECMTRGCIDYDRGRVSLTFVAPCPDRPSFSGPYRLYIGPPPSAPGDLWVKGVELSPVSVNTAGLTREGILNQLVAALLAAGYDAEPSGMGGASVRLNTRHRWEQVISGIDGYGMDDGSQMALAVCNEMDSWVPTLARTWGGLKAIYR